jgi:hypothetical protein
MENTESKMENSIIKSDAGFWNGTRWVDFAHQAKKVTRLACTRIVPQLTRQYPGCGEIQVIENGILVERHV